MQQTVVQAGFKAVVTDAKENPRWKESNNKAMELFREVGIEVLIVGDKEVDM